MKKIICLLLSLVLTVGFLNSCSDTHDKTIDSGSVKEGSDNTQENSSLNTEPNVKESPIDDFEYETNDENGITITRYTGKYRDVTIPAIIDGKPVTHIAAHFGFFSGGKFVSIKLPNSVIVLEQNSFSYCKALVTVELSQNLSIIWDEAFRGCSSLSEIILPNSLTHISHLAFAECTSLEHINIPKNVFSDASSSVFYKSGLKTVELSEQATLPYGIFAYTPLKEIIIPITVKKIESHAFSNCLELEDIYLNDGLQTIGYQAFKSTKIKEIIIPRTVETVTEIAFEGCYNLRQVKFEGNAPDTFIDLPLSTPARPSDLEFIIYYHNTATGFTSPEWFGYTTEIW